MTITNFISSISNLSKATQYTYKCALEKIERELKSSIDLLIATEAQQDILYDHIQGYNVKDKRKNDIMFNVLKFMQFKEFDTKYILSKMNNTDKPTQLPSDIKLPTKVELQELLKKATIINIEHRLLISLLLNYPETLRCDLCSVKVKNYDKSENYYLDGVIYFTSINKTKIKQVIKITLNAEDKALAELIKSKNEKFLLTIPAKNRTNSYSKLITRITKEHLTRLTQTNLRHISAQHDYDTISNDPRLTLKQKVAKLSIGASNRGHCLLMELDFYVI